LKDVRKWIPNVQVVKYLKLEKQGKADEKLKGLEIEYAVSRAREGMGKKLERRRKMTEE